jgi:hypothetical protein
MPSRLASSAFKMEPVEGLEPPVFVYCFTKAVLSPLSHTGIKNERIEGIEPSRKPWQGSRLPLHHIRFYEPTPLTFVTHGFTVVVSVIQVHLLRNLYNFKPAAHFIEISGLCK